MSITEITILLQRMAAGDDQAHHELLQSVYDELRILAQARLEHDTARRSLSATALVHEAWVRMTPADGTPGHWENRRHFFGAAAEAMRRILVDQARRRRAGKRAATRDADFELELVHSAELLPELDLLNLDDALQELRTADPQAAAVIELRFFTGLGLQEIADVLQLSRATVVRELTFAKCWLRSRLKEAEGP